MLTPREKFPIPEKILPGGGWSPRRCIKQDSQPNTQPWSYSGPHQAGQPTRHTTSQLFRPPSSRTTSPTHYQGAIPAPRCIKQDSQPNILPTSYSGPPPTSPTPPHLPHPPPPHALTPHPGYSIKSDDPLYIQQCKSRMGRNCSTVHMDFSIASGVETFSLDILRNASTSCLVFPLYTSLSDWDFVTRKQ